MGILDLFVHRPNWQIFHLSDLLMHAAGFSIHQYAGGSSCYGGHACMDGRGRPGALFFYPLDQD